MEATSAEITVRATPAAVMAVIADLPDYPSWSEGVVAGEVLQAYPDGRPQRGRIRVGMGPVNEDCELAYTWSGDDQVDWTLTSGGLISQLQGRYTCRDNGDGTTTVGYALSLELAVPMIGTVRQRGERQILRGALRGLRRQVEGSQEG
jgi:ribosome-associated toxin RatA of RatAB toxin-antitoxin module